MRSGRRKMTERNRRKRPSGLAPGKGGAGACRTSHLWNKVRKDEDDEVDEDDKGGRVL